jgi:nucleoside-diphosphate-sugar epimerase
MDADPRLASDATKPIVLVTGAAGDLGTVLAGALAHTYTVVGLDRPDTRADIPIIAVDLASDDEVRRAIGQFRERYGSRVASVIHLAAYFDFTGEKHRLYREVNVEGTRRLLAALRGFEVEQFVYAGTMLVHAPASPGERIDESRPIGPKWAYPASKAAAEDVIRREHGDIPVVLLHLAGVYDERSCVPTLAHQIARI